MTTLTAEHPSLIERSARPHISAPYAPPAAHALAAPIAPVAPVSPVGPVEPVGPVGPVGPRESPAPYEHPIEHPDEPERAARYEDNPLFDVPLTSDQQIEERVMSTVGTACRHQLWFLLLTSSDRQVPIALPCDDLPLEPSETHVDGLLTFCAGLMADRGATQLVAVWERPGRGALNQADALWAQTIAATCARRGIHLRAQLLSHTRGVCLLRAADLLGLNGSSATGEPAP
jgi:hypothetical protein